MHATPLLLLPALALCAPPPVAAPDPARPTEQEAAAPAVTSRALLLSKEELQRLPADGPAWRHLLEVSREDTTRPDLSDQDDPTNVRVLAKALVAARTGDAELRAEVVAALRGVVGTEAGGRTLALGRELAAYVLAADLVGLAGEDERRFKEFLREVRREELGGRTLVSTHRDRPNNWGTHAGASRIAVALYLDDEEDLADAVQVLRGFLGDRSAHRGFAFGRDLSWHADPARPVGVNPAGSARDGHSLDGVIPDDQRRAGPFAWPPPHTNYAWEALQGLLLQALLLERAGHDVWSWSDEALRRAAQWLIGTAGHAPTGDDLWQLHVLRRAYPDAGFPAPEERPRPGKGFGFTEFLYGG